ncbi:tRNA (adenosine(37)-N6)-threonylcarbamoyltransferase complex dimerization subunit type 1 TsaB [Aquirufa aurantiipilula]|uniref:tRNA (adenosine(37)-N6)-threonylcarbamoyltransferase complex dimerization subunit type 1 TsaB n=1 Tax=Aquirufa aurantiipilula TaxID=2696561 RepID=UPI001CAA633B|nr:tRNA (adenosine(37)-N6)-threonylcarbamoyltransferase complex dimerization subunit type 1 TsaB [Aquirufa aurantiipilula]MBZ1327317.1 tRNA (adenosine(37)-N6)-threonylcarbamoyltransferase complex dimerization subunit type 1 TsaB [Aquirufa aurantiipilula]
MNLILSIETSTPTCSVAIHQNGDLIAQKLIVEEGGHSKQVTVLIDSLLEENGLNFSHIAAIAVSMGPGSYTGLRIGLATAKGLCFGLDIPLIALPTLKILAQGFRQIQTNHSSVRLLPMLDARRMEVYAACYELEDLQEVQASKAVILDENSFVELSGKSLLAFGNGAQKWQSTCQHPDIQFINEPMYPEAQFMGNLAYQEYLNKNFQDLVSLEPDYLKEFMGTQPKNKAL